MQAYPPTDQCPGGCGKSVRHCTCGKKGPKAAASVHTPATGCRTPCVRGTGTGTAR